jgi:hypothetical protein
MIHKQVNMYCYVLTIVSMIMLWKVLLFHIMGCRIIYVLLRKYEIFIFVFYLYYIRKGFTLKLILILLCETLSLCKRRSFVTWKAIIGF